MVLYVKNKFISLGEGSFVVDEANNRVFNVQGKMFSITKKKFVKDLQGNQLYMVRNKYWHFFTKKAFIFDDDGNKVCKVKERFLSRVVDIVDCEDDYTMESNGLFKGLSIYKNGEKIGSWGFSAQNMSDIFRDSYRLEVFKEEEAPFLVALIIAIDNMFDSRRKK